MRMLEFPTVLEVFLVVLRVCQLMQRAADDCLWFGGFGHDDGFKAVLTRGHVAVLSDEVGVARSLHQQLSHNRIVVPIA